MYSRQNPYISKIVERRALNNPGSNKHTDHIVLDLKGSGLHYQVGDSVGVYPQNDPENVEKTLKSFRFSGDERINDPRTMQERTMRSFLTGDASISNFSRKFLQEIVKRKKHTALEELFEPDKRELLKAYIEEHEVADLILENEASVFTPQEAASLLMPMLPRFYSIASCQEVVGEEVHLTVRDLIYETNNIERRGVCTHFLCTLATFETPIPLFVQPSHGFHLPDHLDKPLIMIGPGTGIAPFRAFMQAREKACATGKHWLFFGEWTRKNDYYYEEDWKRWADLGILELDLAFSRDQLEKVYVQHKMLAKSEQFFQWLEQGASIYVCGDAHHMAKDVDKVLNEILHRHAKDPESYLKRLKEEKRYLRDVY